MKEKTVASADLTTDPGYRKTDSFDQFRLGWSEPWREKYTTILTDLGINDDNGLLSFVSDHRHWGCKCVRVQDAICDTR